MAGHGSAQPATGSSTRRQHHGQAVWTRRRLRCRAGHVGIRQLRGTGTRIAGQDHLVIGRRRGIRDRAASPAARFPRHREMPAEAVAAMHRALPVATKGRGHGTCASPPPALAGVADRVRPAGAHSSLSGSTCRRRDRRSRWRMCHGARDPQREFGRRVGRPRLHQAQREAARGSRTARAIVGAQSLKLRAAGDSGSSLGLVGRDATFRLATRVAASRLA